MSPREWIHDVGNGPFIGVMIFIVMITVGSVLFAKCCVGDRAFMRTGYDFEGYVMRKCPVCVGLPKPTHPRVKEVDPLQMTEITVEEARTSEPPAPPPATAAPPPPPAAATPAPPPATSAPPPAAAATPAPPPTVTGAVPVATKEDEEDEINEDEEDDDEEEEFDFDAYEEAEALGRL